jgi:hypothetical protein
MLGFRDVHSLQESLSTAESEEECLGVIISRVARENDNLANIRSDEDEAKVISRRLTGLKYLAEMIEHKVKMRNHMSVDPAVAAQKVMRYLVDKVVASFDELELGVDFRDHFMRSFQLKIDDWETIKRTVLADVGSDS